MRKFRADLSRRMDDDHSKMTAYRDYDFDRRLNDVRRLDHAIDHFSHAMKQGMVAMKEIASAFEAVGQAFTELTLGNSTAAMTDMDVHATDEGAAGYHPAEDPDVPASSATSRKGSMIDPPRAAADGADAPAANSTKLSDEATSQVRRLAKLFAEQTRAINEGAPFQAYNTGIHRDVFTRLRPVSEHLKGIDSYVRERTEALARYNHYKADVEKVEKRAAKKGKAFSDNKDHKRLCERRDAAWAEYVKRRDRFNETFSMLMEVNDHAAAEIIFRYLALNDEYLRHVTTCLERIMPAMAEVYPLNNEYNSMQNSMILEAVAAARPAAGRHRRHKEHRHRSSAAAGGDGAAAVAGGDAAPSATPDAYTPSRSSLRSGSTERRPRESFMVPPPAAADAQSASRLEEPTEDEYRPSGVASASSDDGHHDLEFAEPPHEPEGSDGVERAGGSTGHDRGYVLTQPGRLHAGSPKEEEAPNLPGAATASDTRST